MHSLERDPPQKKTPDGKRLGEKENFFGAILTPTFQKKFLKSCHERRRQS